MRHWKLSSVALLVLLTLACSAKSPESAFEQFYTHEGAEDMLMDPLILAGDKVVPLIIEKVKDQKLPRRRYAIGFLGNGSYRQALPVLQEILQDTAEKEYFRGDALQSIYMIDGGLGLNLAQKYQGEANHVGEIAKDILGERKYLPERRSYLAAWLGRHD